MCGRSDRRLYAVKRSRVLDDDRELLCLRHRVIRGFFAFWMWVFRLGEGVGERPSPHTDMGAANDSGQPIAASREQRRASSSDASRMDSMSSWVPPTYVE